MRSARRRGLAHAFLLLPHWLLISTIKTGRFAGIASRRRVPRPLRCDFFGTGPLEFRASAVCGVRRPSAREPLGARRTQATPYSNSEVASRYWMRGGSLPEVRHKDYAPMQNRVWWRLVLTFEAIQARAEKQMVSFGRRTRPSPPTNFPTASASAVLTRPRWSGVSFAIIACARPSSLRNSTN